MNHKAIAVVVAILVAASVWAADVLIIAVTGTGTQSVAVGSGPYAIQCRQTATNGARVQYRFSTVDGGMNASDPELSFMLSDNTPLDPYHFGEIPKSATRLNLKAVDGGSIDCSILKTVR